MNNKPNDPEMISPQQAEELLRVLQARFAQHTKRHAGLAWNSVQARLEANAEQLRALFLMEQTGGEPDVIGYDQHTDTFLFVDCSPESPAGRRNTCYDRAALEARKAHKPEHSAVEMAAEMGVELLTEEQYRALQQLGSFDLKTSSWIQTPPEIRALGGALFMDRRYNTVFVYHNGADSYYGARGFRASLRI